MGHLESFGFQPYLLEYIFDPFIRSLFIFPTCCLQYKHQIVIYTAIGKQLKILENNPYFPAQVWHFLLLDIPEIIPDYFSFSFIHGQISIQCF